MWAVFGRPVATVEDFKNMDANGIYVQTADIDLEQTKGYNYWTFNGYYNGGGHEIRNLKRENDGTYGGKLLGMFEQMEGAVVKNLRIVNPSVVGDNASIGALAGKAKNSTFINVRVVGGSVKGGGSNIGGLVGQAESGLFVECMSSATVEGQEAVGGLIGYGGGDITVRRSYATGDVTGTRFNGTPLYIGGLIGNGYRLNISDSYALGSVAADTDNGYAVGGFIGCFRDHNAYAGITNCYSAGAVSGNNNLGGFVSPYFTDGKSDGAGNYWDTETSGQATSAGTGVTGLTTAQMKSGTAFAGWDTDVWKFAEGQYPRFRAFIPKYTVTWLDEDGTTVLKEEIVDEGDTPTCEAPTKEDGDYYTYTFAGWEPEVAPAESNTTYTAAFLAQPKWTGTGTAGDPYVLTTPARIKEIIALYGASVPDEIYVSTGNGVTSESLTAQLPAGYAVRAAGTANVVKIVKIVSVVWKNDDGTVLERDDDVAIGTMPSYDGATPTKAPTAQYSYTFAGWTPSVVTVTGSAEYTATYTPTLRSYTITWLDADGTSLGTSTVAYGATPSHAAPASVYTFTGWTPSVASVTGDATYTAEYSQEVVLDNLTANFTAASGDVLTGSTTYNVSVPGGATVTINGVSVTGAGGGGAPAVPSFSAGGEAVTTKFEKGADGKWKVVAFAELATGTAAGTEDMITILRGDTPDEIETPVTPDSFCTTNAVKVEATITAPTGKDAQFFKVRFGE